MKHLFHKQNSWKVLAFFFDNPRLELHLREIARRLKMSPSTVLRLLAALEKEGLVAKRKETNATYFKASEGSAFSALKVAYTLSKIRAAGVVGIIAEKSKGISCILLYGSAAKGTDDSGSDYDFLAIAAECGASGLELGSLLGRETSLQSYTIGEWKQVSRKNRAFYLEVISNSVPLMGEKPVID